MPFEECTEHLLRCTHAICIRRIPEVQPMRHRSVKDGAQLLLRVVCTECAVVAPRPCTERNLWQICHCDSSHFVETILML